MNDYSTGVATVTNRQGDVVTVEVGTQPTWAVEDGDALAPWRKMMRRQVLDDLGVCDSRGFRVVFTFAPCEDES